jgi:hypothetical protein
MSTQQRKDGKPYYNLYIYIYTRIQFKKMGKGRGVGGGKKELLQFRRGGGRAGVTREMDT